MSYAHGSRIVTDSLEACWDFGNTKSYPGTGTAVADISGNGNDLITPLNIDASNFSDGVLNMAVDEHYTAPSFNIPDFSVEAWYKPNLTTGQRGIYGDGALFRVWQSNDDITWWARETGFGGTSQIWASNTVVVGQWMHIVATAESTAGLKLFVNGVQKSSNTASYVYGSSSGNATIGNQYSSTTAYANGAFGLVRHYSKPLDSNDVQINFNASRSRYGL